MIRGVAFDLEGTVVNLEPIHHQGNILSAAAFGVQLTIDDAFRFLPHFIGGPDETVAEEISQFSGRGSAEQILATKRAHYYRLIATFPIQPRPGFVDFLRLLQLQGIETSIGSLTAYEQAVVILERSGLTGLFSRDRIVLREDVVNIKPAPDVFLETARRMGVSPEEQVVFEDSPRGVEAAIRAGSMAIGMPVYDRPEAYEPLLQAGAIRVYKSWQDLEIRSFLEKEFVRGRDKERW